jgi:hypothetical protein
MKLSLLNTLSDGRGGGINPDGLSLDLQFAADKTLTARKGPTPVFTRGSTGTFVGSNGLIQTAAINAPRFDHDPVTGVCRGLLIEESRTNLLQRSEELDNAAWSKINCSISANSTTSPSGLITADKIVENTTNSLHGVFTAASVATNTTYIGSIYIKAAERSFAVIYTNLGGGNGRYISIPADGTGQVLGTFNANSSTVTLQYVGNGWYRASIVMNTGSNSSAQIEAYPSTNGTTASYLGDGTSGIFAWGAQLEAGSFPTSYIPTTTGTLARSADVCSITGADFTSFYNQSEGTFLLKATSLMATATGGNRTFVSFTDGGYINQQGLYKATNTNNLSFPIGAGIGPAIGTLTAGSPFAVSGAMQVANNAAAFNGAAAVAVTGSATTGISKLEFRDPTGAAAGHPTMHISQFRYYKKRLPNAKIQALTA